MILLALAPGAGIPVAAPLVGLGVFEFGWGVAVLYRDQLVAPRGMRVVALLPLIGWAALLLAAVAFQSPAITAGLGVFPMAVVSLFNLVLVAVLSVGLRKLSGANDRTTPSKRSSRVGPVRYLLALMIGGIAVSLLTTPALASTQAGVDNPHANHGGQTTTELHIPEHSGH
ncbi:MAG: hypothetical protein ABIW81_03960 [Terrimesophilobacter sp.]